MKKIISLLFISLIIVLTIKYFASNYEVNYKLNDHNILVKYENKRYYIEIDNLYNFDIYKIRRLKRKIITDIKIIDDKELYCIIPVINKVNAYPHCYLNDEYVDYNLIDNENLEKYKKNYEDNLDGNFSYNNNLDKSEYILLWNYKGFYKMNGKSYESYKLFNEGIYDNSLMYIINKKILFPDYMNDYNFKSFYLLDIVNGKKDIIESKYEFSYDGYIIGNIKNRVYFFDNKNSSLYEINIKKKIVKLIGSDELGFTKYVGKKLVNVKKSEYKNKAISYIKFDSNYEYIIENNILYKIIKENKNLKLKLFENENIKIIGQYENNLYFTSDDILYKYNSNNGSKKIFKYFELNFNTNDIIYIYNK